MRDDYDTDDGEGNEDCDDHANDAGDDDDGDHDDGSFSPAKIILCKMIPMTTLMINNHY